MYCGNNKEVEASINENRSARGGQPGDQNGQEFLIRPYRNYPWDYVLRYCKTDINKIEVDGSWGKDTTMRTQQFLKVPIDSIISNQPISNRIYLGAVHSSSWEFKAKGYAQGSVAVREIQNMLGVEADGWFGEKTVIACQRFLKKQKLYDGEVDGSMGIKTVKGWQRFLNQY